MNQDRTVWCRFIYSLIDTHPAFEHLDPLEVCRTAGVARQDIFLKDKIDRVEMLQFLIAAIDLTGPDLIGIATASVKPTLLGPAGLNFQTAPTMAILLRDIAVYRNLYAPGTAMRYSEGKTNAELEVRFPALQDSLMADLWIATTAGVIHRLIQSFPHAYQVRFGLTIKGERLTEDQKAAINRGLGGNDIDDNRIKLGEKLNGPGPGIRVVVPVIFARKQDFVFPDSIYQQAWIATTQFNNGDYKNNPLPDAFTTSAKMESLLLTVGRTLTKEQIADRLNMSVKTLERKLKEEIGLTFKQHRAMVISKIVKIKIAAGLERNDLARQLGFKNLAQLNTTLRSIPEMVSFP